MAEPIKMPFELMTQVRPGHNFTCLQPRTCLKTEDTKSVPEDLKIPASHFLFIAVIFLLSCNSVLGD